MNIVKFKFKNGDLLKDNVTGLTGIVMVCAEYSTGCHHYGLQAQNLKDGATREWEWLDVSRLSKIEAEKKVSFDIDPERPSGAFPSGPS